MKPMEPKHVYLTRGTPLRRPYVHEDELPALRAEFAKGIPDSLAAEREIIIDAHVAMRRCRVDDFPIPKSFMIDRLVFGYRWNSMFDGYMYTADEIVRHKNGATEQRYLSHGSTPRGGADYPCLATLEAFVSGVLGSRFSFDEALEAGAIHSIED